jgi:hypothetical protein
MIRFAVIVSLLVIVGCADQSKGTALDECRMQQYLESAAAQDELIPECMKAKSFQMTSQCSPGSDGPEWNQRVLAYTNENPKCYRPLGSTVWIATALSPM